MNDSWRNELITKGAAIDALGDMVMNWTDSDYELGQLNQWKADRKAIIDLPSAQPKRIKGHWIKKMNVTGNNGDIIYRPEWYCSQCRSIYDPIMAQRINFCCVCGADMRGEDDEA